MTILQAFYVLIQKVLLTIPRRFKVNAIVGLGVVQQQGAARTALSRFNLELFETAQLLLGDHFQDGIRFSLSRCHHRETMEKGMSNGVFVGQDDRRDRDYSIQHDSSSEGYSF